MIWFALKSLESAESGTNLGLSSWGFPLTRSTLADWTLAFSVYRTMRHKELIPITSHLYFMDIKSYWAGNTVKYHVRSPNPEEAWQSTFKRLYTYRWLWPPFLEQQLMLKRTAASRTSFFSICFCHKLRPLNVPGESQLYEAGTNAFTFRTMWTILEARSGHGLR